MKTTTTSNPALEQLANNIDPQRTVLFFGAGVSINSGAPTALDLCRYLEAQLAGGEHISDSLAELASILSVRRGRKAVIDSVIGKLKTLKPDAALTALALFPWSAIFSTNYDTLLEDAYSRAGKKFSVVRSNYEYESAQTPGIVPIFKIHGCITQDETLGHRASMILTEQDYDSHAEYRQTLYKRLELALYGGTVVAIGHSMQDPDIQELFQRAVNVQRKQGGTGKIHLVFHRVTPEKADVWRERGAASVSQGDINLFVHFLQVEKEGNQSAAVPKVGGPPLPPLLAPSTIDLAVAPATAHVVRLFYGTPASYGDIAAGYTFERDVEPALSAEARRLIVITGVSGTGKTTLARRILVSAKNVGVHAFEHRSELPLNDGAWIDFEKDLRAADQSGILLVDGCTQFQREVNRLSRALPEDSRLRLVLTAETSAWKIRQKDPRLFSHARLETLSVLSVREIERLLTIVRDRTELSTLVGQRFMGQGRGAQLSQLQNRCQADMFVCLKALFSAESLDQILLKEYANLDERTRGVYRVTCALQAAGALPHRQMVLRVTQLETTEIGAALAVLDGMVEEVESNVALGIYAWKGRHEVIAEIISKYKFSDPEELFDLFSRVVETANTTFYEESRTLREMCSATRGIRALPDRSRRLTLYRKISEAMPGDRVVRHRLVRELLEDERLADAEAEIQREVDPHF